MPATWCCSWPTCTCCIPTCDGLQHTTVSRTVVLSWKLVHDSHQYSSLIAQLPVCVDGVLDLSYGTTVQVGKMIKFVLMVNKMGQTRVSSYYDWMPIPERVALEAEVVRRCFSRSELQCSFFEFRGYKIIYRRVSENLTSWNIEPRTLDDRLLILKSSPLLVELCRHHACVPAS